MQKLKEKLYVQQWMRGPFPSLPYSLLPLPPCLPFLSSPVRNRPSKIQVYRGSGGALSSPSGSGAEPSRNRIWCILALKSDIWWKQF
jgi:hypothetical protein